jgi:hypothetical protein
LAEEIPIYYAFQSTILSLFEIFDDEDSNDCDSSEAKNKEEHKSNFGVVGTAFDDK